MSLKSILPQQRRSVVCGGKRNAHANLVTAVGIGTMVLISAAYLLI